MGAVPVVAVAWRVEIPRFGAVERGGAVRQKPQVAIALEVHSQEPVLTDARRQPPINPTRTRTHTHAHTQTHIS